MLIVCFILIRVLWDFAQSVKEFAFKSGQDVLEELEQMKVENNYLKGIIESNITRLTRIQEQQEKDLLNMRIHMGKTSDQVQDLEDISQTFIETITLNSQAIQSNSEDIENNKMM